jgi:FkbM family methyltransferase
MFDLRSALRVLAEPVRWAMPTDTTAALEQGRIYTGIFQGKHVKWLITNRGDEIQGKQLKCGFYESAELRDLLADIGPRQRIVDIGANIGNHSVFFVQHFGCKELTAIEPYPPALRHLLANLALNYEADVQIRICPVALGSAAGTVALRPPTRFNVGLTRVSFSEGGSTPIRTGDELIGTSPVDFIKIDVEGMELQVLDGLGRVLQNQRPALYIEVSVANRNGFFDRMRRLNYDVARETKAYGDQANFTLMPAAG